MIPLVSFAPGRRGVEDGRGEALGSLARVVEKRNCQVSRFLEEAFRHVDCPAFLTSRSCFLNDNQRC